MANQSTMSHDPFRNHYNMLILCPRNNSFDQFNASLLNKIIIYKLLYTAYLIYRTEAETK